MAKQNAPAVQAPVVSKPAVPTPAAAVPTPAVKPPKVKKVKVVLPTSFPTIEAAQEAAKGRKKGARRIFTVELNGKTFFTVSNNEFRAAGTAALECGAKVTEFGKVAKAPKGLNDKESIMAAAAKLVADPAVLEQLAKLLG